MKKPFYIITGIIFFWLALLLISKTKIEFPFQKKPLSESDFYKEYYNTNNLILINVWATWCQPCLEEFPELDAIKSKNKSLKFISISMDEDTVRLKNFLAKTGKKDDITMQNIDFRDSIYEHIGLVDTYLKSEIIHVDSKQIPYTVLIKNKKILYQAKDSLNLKLLQKTIDENSGE